MNNKILVKPPIRENYLDNQENERVTYISLPEDYSSYSIEYDIKQGGIQYKELSQLTDKRNISRVVSLTSDSVELGIMAVSYLAMKRAEKEGGYEEEQEFVLAPDRQWSESDRKIPVIYLSDVKSYMIHKGQPFEEQGYLFAQAQSGQVNKPYWCECRRYAVCVMVERRYADAICLKYLDLFSTNKNVYVVFIDKTPYDEDIDEDYPFGCMDSRHFIAMRNNYILANASDAAEVTFDGNDDKLYYKNVLKHNLKYRGIKVGKGFSYDRVVNLAKSVNNDTVCDMIDKIISYAIKDMDIQEVKSLSNRDFDFVDQFIRDSSMSGEIEDGRKLMEKNLVGMQDIKQQVYDIVNVMKYNKIRKQMNISGSNFHNVHVMLGASGTAKTTVARYMGQMMFNEKLLPDNRYICINGAELKGKYVGHSAPNTKKLFENYDVIIIDEAYSIVEESGAVDSFGNEAIAQLIIELEKHSTDKLVIFAGYGGDVDEKDNKMQVFLDANPGIKSRITSTFYFKSYTAKEMAEIFKRIAKNSNYSISDDMDVLIEQFFAPRVNMRDFGNGREARVLLETSVVFAAKRCMAMNKEQYTLKEMQTLTKEDIESAMEKIGKNYGKSKRINNAIGFA